MSRDNRSNNSLCKTAQLNVNQLLKYLNTDHLDDEKMSFAERQRKLAIFKLNLRPKQNWITGPPPGVEPYPKLEELQSRKDPTIMEDDGEGEGIDGDTQIEKITIEGKSFRGTQSPTILKESTAVNRVSGNIEIQANLGKFSQVEIAQLQRSVENNKTVKVEFENMEETQAIHQENQNIEPALTANPSKQKSISLDSKQKSQGLGAASNYTKSPTGTADNTVDFEGVDVQPLGSNANILNVHAPDVEQSKGAKKKKKIKLISPQKDSPKAYLVTRKPGTLKYVPLDPKAYPYDIKKKRAQIGTMMQQVKRKRWQSLIEKDLINPNKARGYSVVVNNGKTVDLQSEKDHLFEGSADAVTARVQVSSLRKTRFPSHADKRIHDVRKKYNDYAAKKLQQLQRAATAHTQMDSAYPSNQGMYTAFGGRTNYGPQGATSEDYQTYSHQGQNPLTQFDQQSNSNMAISINMFGAETTKSGVFRQQQSNQGYMQMQSSGQNFLDNSMTPNRFQTLKLSPNESLRNGGPFYKQTNAQRLQGYEKSVVDQALTQYNWKLRPQQQLAPIVQMPPKTANAHQRSSQQYEQHRSTPQYDYTNEEKIQMMQEFDPTLQKGDAEQNEKKFFEFEEHKRNSRMSGNKTEVDVLKMPENQAQRQNIYKGMQSGEQSQFEIDTVKQVKTRVVYDRQKQPPVTNQDSKETITKQMLISNASEQQTANFDERNSALEGITTPQYVKSRNQSREKSRKSKSGDGNELSEDGGFPRSKIRSQDQKRVQKYLKNQNNIPQDDPILKFTQFQSYKQLKSGQSQRPKSNVKSRNESKSKTSVNKSYNENIPQPEEEVQITQFVPIDPQQMQTLNSPPEETKTLAQNNTSYIATGINSSIQMNKESKDMIQLGSQGQLVEDQQFIEQQNQNIILNQHKSGEPSNYLPSPQMMAIAESPGQNFQQLTFDNIHIQQNMEANQSDTNQQQSNQVQNEREDQEHLAQYDLQQQDFMGQGYNQEEYEYDVRPSLKLQTVDQTYMYKTTQKNRPKTIVHKPKGFNITQFKSEYDGEIFYEKDSDGLIQTLPTYRQELQATQRRRSHTPSFGTYKPLCKHIDVFNRFKNSHNQQVQRYTLYTPENIAMQDRRNFIPECVGCVNRKLKFQYYPLQKYMF